MIRKGLVLFVFCLSCLFVFSEIYNVDGVYYMPGTNNTVTVTYDLYGSSKYKGDVVIPETISYTSYVMAVPYKENRRVVGIEDYAFKDCPELTSVSLPPTITSIGSSAFSGCTNLKYINLPDVLSSIGSNVFYNCGKLDSIKLPVNITYVNSYMFYNCASLSSVIFGENTLSISSYAFYGCKNLTSIAIPEGVSSIGDNAFSECSNLKDVTVGNNVSTIGKYCFYNCSNLKNITLGNKVTSIGNYCFSNCVELEKLKLTDNITTLGTYAFQNCYKLSDVYLGKKLTAIALDAFTNCINLTSLTYNVVDFGDNRLFLGDNSFFESVTIGDDAISIPDHFMDNNKKLTNVVFGKNVSKIGNWSFSRCDNLTSITLSETVSELGSYAFQGCVNLQHIDIPNKIETIPRYAFYECKSISSIIIPESVTYIDEAAFAGCSNLTTAIIGKNVSTIRENAFKGCRLAKLMLLSPTIGLNYGAFTDEGERITYVGNSGFEKISNIGTITICNINDLFTVDDVCYVPISAKDRTCAVIDFDNSKAPSVLNIPDKVVYKGFELMPISINMNSFYGCESVQSINIASSIKQIGNSAFFNCKNLRTINLPENLESIGTGLFKDCSSLDSMIIPNKIPVVPTNMFENNTRLSKLTLGLGVSVIGEKALANCNNLIELTCLSAKPASCGLGTIDVINKFSCKLNVPKGSKPVYESSKYWSDFFTIEEFDIDSVTPLINTLSEFMYIDEVEDALKGGQMIVPVVLKNDLDITSYQFDVRLPQGFYIDSVVMSPRHSATHSIAYSRLSTTEDDRVICTSSRNEALSGNYGVVVNLYVHLPDYQSGDFTIEMANIYLATSDGQEIASPTYSKTVHILPFLQGDANDDGMVSMSDFVTTINYILELTSNYTYFNSAAADLNKDQRITVIDVVEIVNLIMDESPAYSDYLRSPSKVAKSNFGINGNAQAMGEKVALTITSSDAPNYTAFLTDVTLPVGMKMSSFNLCSRLAGHTLTWKQIGENKYRILCYSLNNDCFMNEELFDIEVIADGNQGVVEIENFWYCSDLGQEVCAKDSTIKIVSHITQVDHINRSDISMLVVGKTLYINAPTERNISIYSIDGRLIKKIAINAGINIINEIPVGVYLIDRLRFMIQ